MSDAFETTPPAFTDGDEDPAADFLAREQDELAAIDGDASFDFNAAQADPQGNYVISFPLAVICFENI